MGLSYNTYLTSNKIYGCKGCKTHLSTHEEIISRVRFSPLLLFPLCVSSSVYLYLYLYLYLCPSSLPRTVPNSQSSHDITSSLFSPFLFSPQHLQPFQHPKLTLHRISAANTEKRISSAPLSISSQATPQKET